MGAAFSKAHAAEIAIAGTGSGAGTLRALAIGHAKAKPDINITVLPSMGSAGGIKALIAGRIAIAVSARRLTEAERQSGLAELEIARTPLIIAVGDKNPVTRLTVHELASMYAGPNARWPDGTPVRPVLRPIEDSDTTVLKAIAPEVASAVNAALKRDGMMIASSDSDAADALERVPGAIGTTTLALVVSENRKLKAVVLDGQVASTKGLAENRYPYQKKLYLITKADAPQEVTAFLHFIKSPGGRRILINNGSLPSGS